MQDDCMDMSKAMSGLEKVSGTDEPATKRKAESIAATASTAMEIVREFHDELREKFDEVRDAFNELESLVDELEGQTDRAEEAATELAGADREDRAGAHAELVEAADELHTALTAINGDDPPHERLAEAVKELHAILTGEEVAA